MHGRGACMVGGHAWQGACMAGEGCVAGDTATAADGTHPTGMHALFWGFLAIQKHFLPQNSSTRIIVGR